MRSYSNMLTYKNNIIIRIYQKFKTVDDDMAKNKLMKLYHVSPQSDHFGIRKTLAKLKQLYLQKYEQDGKTIGQ